MSAAPFNPASVANMTPRDVPAELHRNAERRARAAALERFLVAVDVLAFAVLVLLCFILKTCAR